MKAKMIKRTKRVGVHRKSMEDVRKAVVAFANQHNVKSSDVWFENSVWDGLTVVCRTPETKEEVEKRLKAAAAARKRAAAEKRREEKWKKQREAEKAVNFLTNSTERVTKLHDELAAAVVAVLEANPKVREKVLKKVNSS